MKPTKSGIISLIALFVSVSGIATAGTVALINGKNIKNGTISAAKLTPVARASLRGQRGPVGPIGSQGFSGPQGIAGLQGIPGAGGATGATGPGGATGSQGGEGPRGGFDPTKLRLIAGPHVTLPSGMVTPVEALCNAGEVAVSGGVYGNVFGTVVSLTTWPSLGKVTADVANDSDITLTVWAYAVCGTP